MTTIQASTISLTATKIDFSVSEQLKSAGNANFEALLSSFDTTTKPRASSGFDFLGNSDQLFSFINDLFDNITKSLNADYDQTLSQFETNNFSFTANFTSTFGTSGPLPAFITATIARLNLSTTQQVALQDISVNNKDIVKTPESVQKIARELQAAGIGYA